VIEAIGNVAASGAANVLTQTHAVNANSNQTAAVGFGDMLAQLTTTAIEKVEQAETMSIAKMSGAEVPLREIVDKVMEAQQALSTTLAIRDKIVQAYTEISHTQI